VEIQCKGATVVVDVWNAAVPGDGLPMAEMRGDVY